jgi:hypothetical protein
MNQPGIGAALKTGVAFTAVAVRFGIQAPQHSGHPGRGLATSRGFASHAPQGFQSDPGDSAFGACLMA